MFCFKLTFRQGLGVGVRFRSLKYRLRLVTGTRPYGAGFTVYGLRRACYSIVSYSPETQPPRGLGRLEGLLLLLTGLAAGISEGTGLQRRIRCALSRPR